MKRPKRNHPCPCGSGRKYKKCCMEKEEGARTMNDEQPKNKFRDEVAKLDVSEQELLERDQRVTYLRFKCQAEVLAVDHQHTQMMIDKLKAFGNMIFRLPNSEGRTGVLEENKKLIEANEKQLAAQHCPRAQQVLLSILEEKFGGKTTCEVDGNVGTDAAGPEELRDEEA